MNIYTNGFRCLRNEVNKEFIIEFFQSEPTVDEHGEYVGAKNEEVSSLVMLSGVAENLAKTIQDMTQVHNNADIAEGEE